MSRPGREGRRDPQAEERFRVAYEAAKVRSRALVGPSLAERLAAIGKRDRAKYDELVAQLSTLDRVRLARSWAFWSRPKQRAPTERHRIFAYIAGRGSGKSRTAAERLKERIEGGAKKIALVGPTLRDIGRYMIGGDDPVNGSCLIDVFPREARPVWNQNKGEVRFPSHPGVVAYVVTAEEAEYRGGNIDTAWCDEVCKWEPRRRQALWNNIAFSLRALCPLPLEIIVTTTPNPHRFIKDLIANPRCITHLGETDENASNLDPDFIADLEDRFGNSRTGRQERRGEILADVEGALFSQALIDAARRAPPRLKRIVVAIDPAISTKRRNDDTAICVIGIGEDDELYVLDFRADKYKPEEWATIALELYRKWHAHAVVAERNRGGDLVQSTVQLVERERCRKANRVYTPIPFVETQASKSKESRAEELSTLHEQLRLHFPETPIAALEDEITEWNPTAGGPSPNGLDAMVWGAWHLCDGFGDAPIDRREGFVGLAAANRAMEREDVSSFDVLG